MAISKTQANKNTTTNKTTRKNNRFKPMNSSSEPCFDRNPQQAAGINNLLSSFENCVLEGFSDDTWAEASEIYYRLANYLLPKEREVLSEVWSTFYVTEDGDCLHKTIESIRAKL